MNVALDIDLYDRADRHRPPANVRYAVVKFEQRGQRWRRVRRLTGPMKFEQAMAELLFQMKRTGLPRVPSNEGSTTMTVFPGFILAQLAQFARDASTMGVDRITIDNHQTNGAYCVHQARARIAGDPTVYRIIIAPANAPIFINDDKRPVAEAFALPLGDS